jgi:hypothetical protein
MLATIVRNALEEGGSEERMVIDDDGDLDGEVISISEWKR